MKYFPLIWATLWRKKTRTIFTLLSMVVAFLLFGVLETVDYAFAHPSGGVTGADKLITTNKYSITLSLPFSDTQADPRGAGRGRSHLDHLVRRPTIRNRRTSCSRFPSTPTAISICTRTNSSSATSRCRRTATRARGALVNSALMKKFGWKVGDKVPLHSTIWTQKKDGSLDWTFDIVGTFDAKDPTQAGQQASTLLFHYDLFDEGRSFGKGSVGWFEERVADPSQSGAISGRIDALFANSPNETKTQPAKDFAMAFMKQFGDIGFVLRAILGAVFFTLLFLTGNTMMQSVRERIAGACGAQDHRLRRRQGAWPGDRRIAAAVRDCRGHRAGA